MIRNILAVILGWLSGAVINMSLIKLGHKVFPIEGIDINDMDAFAQVMPTLSNEYFIFPFLAHALGTLIGATIAGLIATKHKMRMALIVGVLYLLGGIIMNYKLPGPTWFAIVDIVIAFIPMAWIGGTIALKFSDKKKSTL